MRMVVSQTEIVRYILIGIFLLIGYFCLLFLVFKRAENQSSKFLLAVVLFVLYALISVPLVYIINQMGDTSMVLFMLLLLMSCVVVFIMFIALVKNFRYINKRMLIIYILYLLVLFYVTLFSRPEEHSREILINFAQLREALKTNSLAPLQHFFLNAVMFVPVGALFPFLDDDLDSFLYIAPLGLMLSTLIESIQLFLHIGQCDLEDITANALGAVVGLVLFKIYKLVFMRDQDEDYE